jgi:hypothetical protein
LGTSERWQIPHVLDVLVELQPHTVLDVGAGWGKYGVLTREYAPVTRVDGLDVAPPRHPGYDHFYVGDVRELDTVLPADAPRYDLALFQEVLEHLERADGWKVLDRLAARAARVLVTTPLGYRAQENADLPFENHRSGWFPWEFGARYRVHAWRVYPGAKSRWLRLPTAWQFFVLLSAKR